MGKNVDQRFTVNNDVYQIIANSSKSRRKASNDACQKIANIDIVWKFMKVVSQLAICFNLQTLFSSFTFQAKTYSIYSSKIEYWNSSYWRKSKIIGGCKSWQFMTNIGKDQKMINGDDGQRVLKSAKIDDSQSIKA